MTKTTQKNYVLVIMHLTEALEDLIEITCNQSDKKSADLIRKHYGKFLKTLGVK